MRNRTWRRWAAATAAAAAALLGGALTAVPAHADTGPTLQLTATNPVGLAVPPDDEGQISWGLDTQGDTIHDVSVTVDITGISSFADTSDGYCTAGLCTFTHDEVDGHGTGGIVDIKAKSGAHLGDTGTAVITGTASDATLKSYTVKVTVGQVGLVVGARTQLEDVTPGGTVSAPLTVANTGSLTSTGVDYRFAISPGLSFAQHYANCAYGTAVVDDSWGQTVEDAVCHFDTPLEPGKKYALSTPLKLKVKDSALFEFLSYQATSTGSAVPSAAKTDGGPTLSLVPDGTAPKSGQAHDEWIIDAENTADLAVTGDTVTAAPGTEATLTAAVTNNGPASVDLFTSDDQLSLLVDIPKGTTATKVPSSCGPWTGGGKGEPALGAPQYICDLDQPFDAGHTEKLTFTVKVDADAPATTTGDVVPQLAYGGRPPYDTDTDNSTGHFTVHVPGGTTTGGSTGSTTAASAGTGNQPGTDSATRTALSGGSTGGSDSGATGSLASTGSNGTMTLLWSGAACLALGSAAFLVVRSRRSRAAA
jgi:LPXTG-motif cell wall-anchored protein